MILGKLGDMDKKRLQELEMVLVSFIKHNYIFISIYQRFYLSMYFVCVSYKWKTLLQRLEIVSAKLGRV